MELVKVRKWPMQLVWEKTRTNVIEEFNKLKQKGIIEEYQVRFEELRSLLSLSHPSLDEAYFVSSFICGLDDQIRSTVKMLYPTLVGQATEQAYLHEMALEAFAKKHRLSLEGKLGGGLLMVFLSRGSN